MLSTLEARLLRRVGIALATLTFGAPCLAQTRALTAGDYARAEKFMGYNTNPLVFRAGIRPRWLADDRFWYRVTTQNGNEFVLVDPTRGTRGPAFDQTKIATALSMASGTVYDAFRLPFTQFDFSNDGASMMFNVDSRRWTCDLRTNQCTTTSRNPESPGAPSPDGKRAAFIREYNLWVRDVATGKETQLTTGGLKDFGYATDNAGWIKSDRPVLLWSPDSKKIATFQHDQRNVGEMYLVDTRAGHPHLEAWKYPLPGDENVAMIQRVIIDVDAAKVVRLQMPPDQHRSTFCDHIVCRGTDWADVQWAPDSASLVFVSSSRDHKQANLRVTDATTGVVRDVLEEKVATQYESGQGRANWHYLAGSNEAIWFSERDGWGHLYLYDFATGKLKNRITSVDWGVLQLVHVDEKARIVYFMASGREKGNPYFEHLYRVGLDGKDLTLLTPEEGNHVVEFSPSKKYFTDTYSQPDAPP